MIDNGVRFEESEFGVKTVLSLPWSELAHEQILRRRPDELELNSSKGWRGEKIDFVRSFEWLKSITIIEMTIDDIEPIHALRNLRRLSVVTYCRRRSSSRRFRH